MKTAQLVRISIALAIIFTAGILTGRFTAPRPPTPVPMAGVGGKIVTSDTILARLTAELGLDPAQKAKVQVILEDVSEQMAVVPPASPERRELFRKCVPRMREVLRPDQHADFDRYVEKTERRWARLIRRRDAMQASPADSTNSELPPPRPRQPQP